MYKCIGSGPVDIGGLLITFPKTMNDTLMLIRSDANRYITILALFAILGLQNLFIVFRKYFKEKF